MRRQEFMAENLQKNTFQIGEIAKFFDIPASTLRYWEEMGVLRPEKDPENHYREYEIEDLMNISDIIFYKKLGLPLKNIRQMESTSPDEHYQLFEEKLADLKEEEKALQQRMEKLHHHMEAIQALRDLRENPYQETDIDTDCIVSFDFIEREKLLRYIENPYLYSRVQHSSDMKKEQRGITIETSEEPEMDPSQIIWKNTGHRYIAFLMKEEISDGFPNDLMEHLEKIQEKYQTGAVISRFLIEAREDRKIYDFYKTYVEIV
jgi:DNA-binding transcriptional MerR regulator